VNDERHAPLLPLRTVDGHLPLEDHGLLGDGATAALVGRDGAVSWLCVPRFDGEAVFCSILDPERGGAFTVAPEGLEASAQWYEPDTGILHTVLRGRDGTVRVTDALALRPGADLHEARPADANQLVRSVRVLAGRPTVVVDVTPRGGAEAERHGGGIALRRPGDPVPDLHLVASRPLDGLRCRVALDEGEQLDLALRWGADASFEGPVDAERTFAETATVWRDWIRCVSYDGPATAKVRRSALTLKMLDHVENGAIVAAPTSSLPEAIGGPRNWDYRFSWIRDAAFSVYALRRIGLTSEADDFLTWVLAIADRGERPRVLYTIDGGQPSPEREDDGLAGYRGSPPVRWGNAAADQRQNDVYGEIVDCAWQWVQGGGTLHPQLWERLRVLVDVAAVEWDTPDHGIWEVRTSGHVFTYSAALCQVALDRGARLAAELDLPGDHRSWRRTADAIRDRIVEESWDPELRSFTEHLGGGKLDASLLCLPLRRVLPADHPRMVATTEAVVERLGAGDGLLYRYLPDESPDGLEGEEGAFLLCSFWLVDNLVHQGRLDEAGELFESLCARTNPLGLLAEQVDPGTGAFLGNFPQAFSHVGLVSSAVNLSRHLAEGTS
jgi:alpha,alpha-trehalase